MNANRKISNSKHKNNFFYLELKKTKMKNLLIIKEFGDLMLLEIINEKWKQMSEQISTFISSMKVGLSQMEQYEEKKNILFELIDSELLDHNEYSNLKAQFVSIYNNATEFLIVLLPVLNR